MEPSHQILKQAIDRVGAKQVAARLGVSQALVYKWCQSREDFSPNGVSSGAANPLDRLQKIYEITQDPRVIDWLCRLSQGYFVPEVNEATLPCDREVLKNMQTMIKEFAETLTAISQAYVDKRITLKEAQVIRKEWDDLKRIGEGFVRACESGRFNK